MIVTLQVDNNYIRIGPKNIVDQFGAKLKNDFAISYQSWVRDWRTKKVLPVTRYVSLYRPGGILPSGWLERVSLYFTSRGFQVVTEDSRASQTVKVVPAMPEILNLLHPYQREAFKFCHLNRRGILKMPTGSGKTIVAQAIISAAGAKALYIVPTLELLYQTAKSFTEMFGAENIGIIGDAEYISHRPITIATVQTLWARFEAISKSQDFDRFGTLILDEAHHCSMSELAKGANTWYKIAQRIPAYWRFGLTATPGKGDDPSFQMLTGVTGPVIYEISSAELVRLGYLSIPKIVMFNQHHNVRYPDWHTAKTNGISLNISRNQKIADVAMQLATIGKRVLVIVDRVETQGQELYQLIGPAYSSFIHGTSDSKKRKKARDSFKDGSKPVLIGTVFGEGVDFPFMDCVINAAGGKSSRQTIQRFGRVLRKHDGKYVGICVDFNDHDSGKRYLAKHSKERIQTYQDLEFEILFADNDKTITSILLQEEK